MPYIGNVTTDFNVSTANINNGAVTGEKLSQPFNYDSGTLYLDDTNNRVGIGTISPSYTLDVQGSTITSRVRGSGGTYALGLYENDSTYFYTGIDTSTGAAFGAGNYARVVWSYGAYPLVFATNNTERLRITSAGLVGIGTSAPNNTLHVVGTGSTQAVFERTGSNGVFIGLKDSSGSLAYLGSTNGVFSIQTPGSSYSDKLVVTSAGLVGIGTSAPATNLDVVVGSGTATQKLGSSSVTGGSYLNFHGASASKTWFIGANYNFAGVLEFTQSTTNGGTTPSSTPAMVLSAAGSVGIGTASPSKELQISATTPTIRLEENSASAKRLELSVNSSGEASIFATQSATQLLFGTVGTERARIDSSGRLLVGVANAVAGSQNYQTLIARSATSTDETLGLQYPGVATWGITVQSNADLSIKRDGTERARIDSSGRLLVGTSTARSNFFNTTNSASLQIEGTSHDTSGISIVRNQSGTPPHIDLGTSRGTTIGSNTLVQDGDTCGYISFQGNDGSEFVVAAAILASIDGTPGANDMPGRLVFSTTSDGASSPTERFRISNDGSMSAVIPGGSTLYPASFCRAWVNFNGTGTVAIRASYNVSSITDNGTGDYTVNFTTALADANYSVFGTCNVNITGNNSRVLSAPNAQAPTTSSVRVGTTFSTTGAYEDQLYVYVSIFR